MQVRKIIHIDMDAFYAAVEQRDNPSLKGKPIIVGGLPSQRGVVATASYEARKFGIHSAMASSRAVKLCPQLIIVKPNHSKYKEISKSLMEIYREYTDIIEPVSLDECYLDVTFPKQGNSATLIAKQIKQKIKDRLQLTASAGVSVNKMLAKIASDINKPNGMCVIPPAQIKDFVKNLAIKKIWGVGKVTQKKLTDMNIKVCGDLQEFSIQQLIEMFGSFGEKLYYFVRGIDNSVVKPYRKIKSISNETTFLHDQLNQKFIEQALYKQVERVSKRLQQLNIAGKTISIKIKYYDFTIQTRSVTIAFYTDELSIIFEECKKLLQKTQVGKKKIRLIGAGVSNLNNTSSKQLLLDWDKKFF